MTPSEAARKGGRPYPRKRSKTFRPLGDVEAAILEWCRLRGLDPNGRGNYSDALNSLVLAGAAANPRGVDITIELRSRATPPAAGQP